MAPPMNRVFLDANVYFSGFYSSRGASALILELVRHGKIEVYASRLVLQEADRNLRKKTDRKKVEAFHQFLKQAKIHVIPSPREERMRRFESCIHPKDVPVLAAAIEAQVDFLITLDRRHFLTTEVLSLAGEIKICTPGDYLRQILPRLTPLLLRS